MQEQPEMPDYKKAAEEMREKFAALGIVATFGEPAGKVDEPGKATSENPKPRGWPHVAFHVTFSRVGYRAAFAVEYRVGTGHAPWKSPAVVAAAKNSFREAFGRNDEQFVAERECLGRGKGSRWATQVEASAAAAACKIAKWTPDPAEIFAGHCRDGFDARDRTFEDWAADYGMEEDSRAAEKSFNACRDAWAEVCRIVSPADAEAFAEMAARL